MDYKTEEMKRCPEHDYLPPMAPLPPLPPTFVAPPHTHGQHTKNYGLPLWRASDVTSWLTQMNAAMMRIDEVMHDLALRTGINGMPDDITASVSELLRDTEVMKHTIADLSNKAANQELLYQNAITQLTALKTDMGSIQLSLTNLDTRIMTAESKSENVQQAISLVKSDLQTMNTALKAFRETYGEFQLGVNKTLAEHQVAIEALQNTEPEVTHQIIITSCEAVKGSPTSSSDFESATKIENCAPYNEGTGAIEHLSNGLFQIALPQYLLDATDLEFSTGIKFKWLSFRFYADTEYKLQQFKGRWINGMAMIQLFDTEYNAELNSRNQIGEVACRCALGLLGNKLVYKIALPSEDAMPVSKEEIKSIAIGPYFGTSFPFMGRVLE